MKATDVFPSCISAGVNSADREPWLKARRELVTASEVAAILGVDPWSDAHKVYASKVFPQDEGPLSIEDSRFWGQVLERPVLENTANYYGWPFAMSGDLLIARQYPFVGATLDALVNRNDGFGWIPFECKNSEIHKDWDPDTQELPRHVLVQCQTQLLVTAAPVNLCFALLSRYRPVQVTVHPHVDFFGVIVETAEEFLELVKRCEEPPATAKSSETLKRLYPVDDGQTVQLTPEALEWTREYVELGKQVSKLMERRDTVRNLVEQQMKTATFGILPGDVDGKKVWRNTLQKREAYTVEARESRQMYLLKGATMPGEKAPKTTTVIREAAANDVEKATADLIRMPGKRRR